MNLLDVAREAGARVSHSGLAASPTVTVSFTASQLAAFARRIREDEREACAKIAEAQRHHWVDGSDQFGRPCPARINPTPKSIAAAIRSSPKEAEPAKGPT